MVEHPDAIVEGAVDTVVALKTEPNVTIEMGGETSMVQAAETISSVLAAQAEAEEKTSEDIIQAIFDQVQVP